MDLSFSDNGPLRFYDDGAKTLRLSNKAALATQRFQALHQVALLVGMVKGASYYNPRRNPERAMTRRNLVLDLMAEQGMISQQQANDAKAKPLDVTVGGSMANTSYPAFMDLVATFLSEWLKRHVFGVDKELEAFILGADAK